MARDIMASRSVDDGLTWEAPYCVTTAAGVTEGENPSIDTDGLGRWVAVWHEPSDVGATGSNILASVSDDLVV